MVKKYKLLRKLGEETGMSRNKLSKITSKSINVTMPGKADCVKSIAGERSQKRILTDYLSTLYQKLVSENPRMKLSFTSFCRIRPKHVLLMSFITRDTCLCTKHQNMSLTLKAVKAKT